MLRNRPRLLTCFYCGKRSNTSFDRGSTRQFDCKFCDATNYLDQNGEITNPPVAKVNAGSSTMPQYAPKPNIVTSTTAQPNPDTIFCEACLKHQRLFVASMAQYEAEGNKDDFDLDKDYYRYRRNLVERYPQCCERCKPRVEAAIGKADYQAKTDYLRRMADKSRDPRRRTTKRRSWLDLVHLLGRLGWFVALMLQLVWHLKALVALASTSDSGMKDPDDESWMTQGLQWVNEGVRYAPGENAIFWSLVASLASVWWNPRIIQVVRGFDKHLVGLSQWYVIQVLLAFIRLALFKMNLGSQSRDAQLANHLLLTAMTVYISVRAPGVIKTDSTPLFGNSAGMPTASDTSNANGGGFTFRKQPQHQPSIAEALNDALPQPGEAPQPPYSNDTESSYPYQFVAPSRSAPQPVQEEDAMEWQPTGSTTLPRALRNPNAGAGNRPFGQAPVQENNRPFYYRAPEAPTNPAKTARNGPKQPVLWGSQRSQQQNGFEAQGSSSSSSSRKGMEFQQPKFFAQQPLPDRKDDEQLAGLAGSLSFDESRPQKSGWFGFGK